MKIQFVTSVSDDYYEKHGRDMLLSFLEHTDFPIKVYYEDTVPDLVDDRIEYVSLYSIGGVQDFLRACSVIPALRGDLSTGKVLFQYNMFKFARIIIAENHAARNTDADVLVRLDADTVVVGPWTAEWFEERFADGDFMLVTKRNDYHMCSSLSVWNLKHEQNTGFWDSYLHMLLTGRFLFLEQWHDISIKEKLIEALQLKVKDIAAGIKLPPGPINVLEAVLDGIAIHNKGRLKKVDIRRHNQLALEIHNRLPANVLEISDSGIARELLKQGMNYQHITDHEFEEYSKGHAHSADLVYVNGVVDLQAASSLMKDGGVMLVDGYREPDDGGSNAALDQSGLDYTVMPVADYDTQGGRTKMVLIEAEAA